MNEERSPQDQLIVPDATEFSHSQLQKHDFHFLLIASALIALGFFLPWLNTNSLFSHVTINGSFMISEAGKIESYGFLIVLLLLSIPICTGIIGYYSYARKNSEKLFTICISLATLFPLYFFVALTLSAGGRESRQLMEIASHAAGIGAGAILMIIGSLYYAYFVIKEISKKRWALEGPLWRFGAMGGAISALITYLLLRLVENPKAVIWIVLLTFGGGIIVTGIFYKNFRKQLNYTAAIALGFLNSVHFAASLILISFLHNRFSDSAMETSFSLMLFLLWIMAAIQIGFAIAAVAFVGSAYPLASLASQNDEAGEQVFDNDESPTHAAIDQDLPVELKRGSELTFAELVHRHRIKLIIIGSCLLIGFVVWLFVRPTPEKFANAIAKSRCSCEDTYTNESTRLYTQFLNAFEKTRYPNKQQARDELNKLLEPVNTSYSSCLTIVGAEFDKIKRNYIQSPKSSARFEKTYLSKTGSCTPVGREKLEKLWGTAEQNINTIASQIPDSNRIKSDLIGNTIPGWRFELASEIKQLAISNVSSLAGRMEYLLDLKLENYNSQTYHEAQVIATYIESDYGWQLDNLREVYITWDNPLEVNEWRTVVPLANCTFSVSDSLKIAWRTSEYSGEIISGPDAPGVRLPNSSRYFLRSREERPIIVRFTYRPIR
jgi:hypothetical protein